MSSQSRFASLPCVVGVVFWETLMIDSVDRISKHEAILYIEKNARAEVRLMYRSLMYGPDSLLAGIGVRADAATIN